MDSFYNDRRRFPLWLLVLGMCGCGITYFWAYADHVMAIALVAITIAGFSGYRMGAAKLFAFFGGLALAFFFAPTFGRQLEPKFLEWFGTEGFANRMLSMVAVGIAILMTFAITVRLLTRRLLEEWYLLQGLNKWGGFSFGVAQGAGVMLLLLGGLLIVEPLAKNRLYSSSASGNSKMQKAVVQRLIEMAEQTRSSAVAPWVLAYNPFERVPQLETLHRSMRVFSDPQKLNRLMQSGELAQLQQDPAIRQAIDQLSEDPQIRSFFESGKTVDPKAALSLMDNPTIMKILEQPDLLNQLSDMFDGTDAGSERPAHVSRTR